MGIGEKQIDDCSDLRGSAFRQNLSMMDAVERPDYNNMLAQLSWSDKFIALVHALKFVYFKPDEDSLREEQLCWTDKWS